MKYFEFGKENKELMVLLHGGGTSYLGVLPTAKKIAEKYGVPHISTGDIFRGIAPSSESGKLLASYSSKGLLVPEEATVEIFGRYVEGLVNTNKLNPAKDTLLLDGIPRTVAQVDLIKPIVDVKHIFVLDIKDEETIVARLLNRAKIEGRKDDADVNVIKNRLNVYKESTAKVLEKYDPKIISHITGGSIHASCTNYGCKARCVRLSLRLFMHDAKKELSMATFVMVNGIPGNMGKIVAETCVARGLELVPFSLTGEQIVENESEVAGKNIQLLKPSNRESRIGDVLAKYPGLIAVDFTHPTAVNDNAKFYVAHGIPFVMGTTGL